MKYSVYTDASWHPSHRTGIGIYVLDHEREPVARISRRIQGVPSNTHAEMHAIKAAIVHCQQYADKVDAVVIHSDARSVVHKIQQGWSTPYHRSERHILAAILDSVEWLARHDVTVRFAWVPRERNTNADALARAGLDRKLA